MRVLFFTAAAVAACLANITNAVMLETEVHAKVGEGYFVPDGHHHHHAQIYNLEDMKPAAAPAKSAQELKVEAERDLIFKAVEA